jgi:hypothetical protein
VAAISVFIPQLFAHNCIFTSKALVGTSFLPSSSRSQATMLTAPTATLLVYVFFHDFQQLQLRFFLTAFISSPLITMRASTVTCVLLALAASPTLAAPIVLVRGDNHHLPDNDTVTIPANGTITPQTDFEHPDPDQFLYGVGVETPVSSSSSSQSTIPEFEYLPQYSYGIGPALTVVPKSCDDSPQEDSDSASEVQKRGETEDLVALLQALNRRSDNIFNRRDVR